MVSEPARRKHPRLGKAPLVSVICQARFTPVLALDSPESQPSLLAALQAALPDYPQFARVAQQGLIFGPEGVQTAETKQTSFQFSADDGTWVVGIGSDSVSLQTQQYEHFNDFLERWRVIADAVREFLAPGRQTRLGLRYTDEIRHPDAQTPASWRKWLKPELLGLAASDQWAPLAMQSFQDWMFELDVGRAAVRHGFLPETATQRGAFYLIDVDAFVDEVREFNVADQLALLDQFNDASYEFFRWSLEPDLYQLFEPEEVSDH